MPARDNAYRVGLKYGDLARLQEMIWGISRLQQKFDCRLSGRLVDLQKGLQGCCPPP